MNNFIILEEICQTQFSTILRCKNKTTRDIVVLKEIRQKKTEDAPSKEVLREILIMMNFTHPHIVKYNSVFVHKCQVVIEMEFCITSLSNVIKKISKPFYIGQIKKIIRSIALGIKFLHNHDIIHRDIKPGNIFIDENCVVKIGDFGSARISPQQKKEKEEQEEKKKNPQSKEKKEKRPLTPGVGTKWYKAPEIIFGNKHYDKSVDIWSFGCLMAEMFLLEPLFPGSTDFEMINLIFSFIGFSKEDEEVLKPQLHINHRERKKNIFVNTFDTAEKDSIDLMSKMLVANPNKRITVEEILKHPFLKNEESYFYIKAENYKSIMSFAKVKYVGDIPFRIFISFILFLTLALVISGSITQCFSFYFHGLAGYALDLLKIPPHREYSIIQLGIDVPGSYENPKDPVIIFTQVIYFLTVLILPLAFLLNLIILWFVPMKRKAQKIFYNIAEILNAWSCIDVFVIAILASLTEIGQFTKFIVGDKCDSINPFIKKYFSKTLDGHDTCFEVKTYLEEGCWLFFAAAISFFISSFVILKVCRNALNERLPEHVKEYLKTKKITDRVSNVSNINDYNSSRESLVNESLNNKLIDNKNLIEDDSNF